MPSLQKIDLGTKGGGVDFPFAFRTAGLDRAAHLRIEGTPRHHPDARAHLFWRGKLLVVDGRPLEVPLDQVAPEECREAPIFVGLSSSGPRLAADLALWSPREDAETVGQFTDASLQGHPAFPGAHFAEVRGVMPGLTELEGECIATARALLGWHTTHRFCANCSAETLVESSGWVRKCPACGT
jgi:NAD+ diphosphatase